MSAVITEKARPWVVARCPECDDLYIGEGFGGAYRVRIDRMAAQHDRYAHSDPPIPHPIAHVDKKLIGYSVQCMCYYRSDSDTSNLSDWHCPLDRTIRSET